MFETVISAFSALPEIEAIALGGSRSGDHFDETSDYDIYLYCTAPIPEETRRAILEPVSSRLEISNHFWELEDNGSFSDGIDFDILYRNLDDFAAGIASVVEDCQPQNAYTTCMWHNLLTCKILYDPSGRLTSAKERFSVPYPETLRERILDRGWKLLSSAMPAYELQIKKAANRGDLVSVNHRTAAFLETYFDMIFALNRKTHPGEKRLMQLCREQCEILPENFEENLNSLFSHLFRNPEAAQKDIDAILVALAKIK
jgi:hypothetical protein